MTLHKFVSKLKSTKIINRLKNYYFIVDEISMAKEIFYKFLLMLNQMQLNIKFIIVGDFNKLPPVNDRVNVLYNNSLALFELCQGN